MAKKDLATLESSLAAQSAGAWTAPAAPEQDAPRPGKKARAIEKAVKASTREGTANISAHLPKHYQFDLKGLALAQSHRLGRIVPVQDLIAEALDDLFAKHRHPTSK